MSIFRKTIFLLFFWMGMPFNHFESQVPQRGLDYVGFELYQMAPSLLMYDLQTVQEILASIDSQPESFRYKIR